MIPTTFCVTLSLENGMDKKTLSIMLGYVLATTTLDIYTHITGDMQPEQPQMTDFQPEGGRIWWPGEINDHLDEDRYSPAWPDGKKHSRNVYAHTREECEEKLKVLIVEMKAEITEAKQLKK